MSHCYPADNILPIYTYCEDPPCLIFQYMENGTLYHKLQDTRHPLTWKQRGNVGVGTARGLYHLHENNVVHCDLKGLNILLDKHMEPKIADFGTNRLLYGMDEQTVSERKLPSMAGTPYYLPNWYLSYQEGKAVRKQIDVYSFGMVMLEIMSGKLPDDKYRGKTLRDFVNTSILSTHEPPNEYIAPVDNKNRKFEIVTETEVSGNLQRTTRIADWATVMFDIGKQCTIYDKTHPVPWKAMQAQLCGAQLRS